MLIHGNAWMAQQLELGQLSIAKLRKLFQIQGSEKAPTRKPKNDPASSDNKGSNTAEDDKKGHGRNGADAYQGAAVDVVNPELNPGDTCPAEACDCRLYEMSEPGVLVSVTVRQSDDRLNFCLRARLHHSRDGPMEGPCARLIVGGADAIGAKCLAAGLEKGGNVFPPHFRVVLPDSPTCSVVSPSLPRTFEMILFRSIFCFAANSTNSNTLRQ